MKTYRILATKETTCFLVSNHVKFNSDGEYLYFNHSTWFVEEMSKDESIKHFTISEIEEPEELKQEEPKKSEDDIIIDAIIDNLTEIRQIERYLNGILNGYKYPLNAKVSISLVKK